MENINNAAQISTKNFDNLAPNINAVTENLTKMTNIKSKSRNQAPSRLTLADFSPEFFQKMLRSHFEDDQLVVTAATHQSDANTGSSIICELTASTFKKLIGHFPYNLDIVFGNGEKTTLEVLVKSKPLAKEVIKTANLLATLSDFDLSFQFNQFKNQTMFSKCDERELTVMSQKDSRFTKYAPTVYGTYKNPKREAYVLVEERLQDMILMDTSADTSEWTEDNFRQAIHGMASLHSISYDNVDELEKQQWMGNLINAKTMTEKSSLWRALSNYAAEEFPEIYPETTHAMVRTIINTMPEWQTKLDNMTKTLIHNDFNPRNIAFKNTSTGPRLCAYDWELATVAVPQMDLAEFLAFTAFDDITEEKVNEYIELHRTCLEKETGKSIDPAEWREGYKYSLYNLAIYRFAMYFMAQKLSPNPFMERLFKTLDHLLKMEMKTSL